MSNIRNVFSLSKEEINPKGILILARQNKHPLPSHKKQLLSIIPN
jgi:hypothetical protein